MNKTFIILFLWVNTFVTVQAQKTSFSLESSILLKKPGNKAVSYVLTDDGKGNLVSDNSSLPVQIKQEKIETDSLLIIKVTVFAEQEV
jgi:hypothetical protein